jgi:outer membrane protein assembly factor BamB
MSKAWNAPGILAALGLVAGVGAVRADDWPQWFGPRRDGVWRESGIVERFPAGGPAVRWRVPIGPGYSGPAVAGGRVFLTDRQLATGAANPPDAFQRAEIRGRERVVCLNEKDGTKRWEHTYDATYTISYPAGPRATPLVAEGRVWTLGAEGHLHCLDAETGAVLWKRELRADFGIKAPEWGFSGHPLLDGDRLVCLVGGPGSVVVAFDKSTGAERWRALTAKEPGYSPPTLVEVEGRRQLVLWHPEAVNGLDPGSGRLLWTFPWEIRFGLTAPQPVVSGNRLFLTAFYDGPLLLRLPGAGAGSVPEAIWRGKKRSEKDTWGLHSIIPTAHIVDGHIYGVCSYGQLRCLRLADGERVWETFAATTGKETRWGNAFLIRQADRFFLFNELGDLILARLTPAGYDEIDRAHLVEPTGQAAGRAVVWTLPAFANRSVYARNDKEIACFDLAQP